jgi:hypothetical protein
MSPESGTKTRRRDRGIALSARSDVVVLSVQSEAAMDACDDEIERRQMASPTPGISVSLFSSIRPLSGTASAEKLSAALE